MWAFGTIHGPGKCEGSRNASSMAMGQNPNRTPSEHPSPVLKWVVHQPQNASFGLTHSHTGGYKNLDRRLDATAVSGHNKICRRDSDAPRLVTCPLGQVGCGSKFPTVQNGSNLSLWPYLITAAARGHCAFGRQSGPTWPYPKWIPGKPAVLVA